MLLSERYFGAGCISTGSYFTDEVPVASIPQWEEGFHKFMATAHPEVLREIAEKMIISDDLAAALRKACEEYKQTARF